MKPALDERLWVFCSVLPESDTSGAIFTFLEDEGLTMVLPHETARERHLDHTFLSKRITLTVNSALEAVGFLASVTWYLAERGIPCNAVSAYHHDHLFVPADQADAALDALQELSNKNYSLSS